MAGNLGGGASLELVQGGVSGGDWTSAEGGGVAEMATARARDEVARAEAVLSAGASVFGESALQAAAAVVVDCLAATKARWNNKSGTVVAQDPDWAIRLDAARLVLGYKVGLPVAKSVHVTGKFDPRAELAGVLDDDDASMAVEILLRENPAVAKRLARKPVADDAQEPLLPGL